ncbi:hypothetical protein EJ05DRAFT_71160 [Pseudovirgaria hyperparasitica]|uniref:Zn(2)-C6 fungal-type domain-containing protein n=1 Tax=Pseudovirgaria hyperparasitica TaxID=470096 RepID=A0A6A6W155_9PEZI|nr:uncharacterized protein EJ05DRAFT_71160 [Pseudovirgaria hyperparasitica]KAF2756642.1 hypothetical protein EJ05DRAFT_71160 [Pseudovirgaria hyperparasitica]
MANRNNASGLKDSASPEKQVHLVTSNEAKPPQDFLFVDSSSANPRQKSYRGNRSVRSHVMQRARKERPWSTSRQTIKRGVARLSPEATRSLVVVTIDQTRQNLIQERTLKKEDSQRSHDGNTGVYDGSVRHRSSFPCSMCQSPDCIPGLRFCARCHDRSSGVAPRSHFDTALDPFDTLPVSLTSEVRGLWQYFFNNMCPQGIIPMDIRHQSNILSAECFPAALVSPVFMHGLLCSTALHRYVMGKGSFDSVIYHRQATVSEINSNLNDSELSISDGTIGAVFFLLSVEESMLGLPKLRRIRNQSPDEPNEQVMHMNGLQRMIALRGGLGALTTTRFVQSMILWHVTARAITSFEPPYISPLSKKTEALIPLARSVSSSSISLLMKDDLQRLRIDDVLIDYVDDIAVLSIRISSWLSGETHVFDPLELQNQASLLECSLLHWQNAVTRNALDTTICLGLLAFVVKSSEPKRSMAPIQYKAIKKLREALTKVSIATWSAAPGVLIWVLNVAILCTQTTTEPTTDHFWFLQRAAEVYRSYHIDSEELLLTCLHSYPWVDYEIDEVIRRKWVYANSLSCS